MSHTEDMIAQYNLSSCCQLDMRVSLVLPLLRVIYSNTPLRANTMVKTGFVTMSFDRTTDQNELL
jgi:hypothetical protein